MMQGGVTIVGVVTGEHLIEDIKVLVPHKTAVFISAEDYLRSKDLHRALSQGRVFRIDAAAMYGTNSPPEPPPPPRPDPDNQRLRQELAEAAAREAGLTQVLMKIQQEMADIKAGLGRLESRPAVAAGPQTTQVARAQDETWVDGDAPTFIPTKIMPEDTTAQIRVEKQVAEGSSLNEASNKLRELRKKGQG